KIVRVPQVEVADLRTLDADDAEEVAGRNLEGARLARRHDDLADLARALPGALVEGAIVGRHAVNGIDDDRLDRAALGGIGGSGFAHQCRGEKLNGRSSSLRPRAKISSASGRSQTISRRLPSGSWK